MIKEITNTRIKKINLLDVSIEICYNNEKLVKQFFSIIKSHIDYLPLEYECDMNLNLICDDDLYDYYNNISDEENVCDEKNIIVVSYCSTEKGMIRAYKKSLNDGKSIFVTQKNHSLFFIESQSNVYSYIINKNILNNDKFNKDLSKYFDHIINKKMNCKKTILVHGAAVSDGEGIILIIGQKRSGKTTLFLDLLRRLRLTPVSVDKCHLKLEKDIIKVLGYPTRLRVMPGTLSKYGDEFYDLLPDDFKYADEERLWKGESKGKVDIDIKHLEEFCKGKKFVKSGKLKMIIFPQINKDNVSCFSKVNYDKFLNIMESQIFTPNNPEEDWWSDIGVETKDEMEKEKTKILHKIWNEIPTYILYGSSDLSNQINAIKSQL